MSYGQMKHPSLLNLGLRKSKHVQFVRDDQPKDSLEGGWLNSLLAMFHPAGVVMRRLDELRVILCLYEVIMLPLRLAFGTGYGLISGPRYALLDTNQAGFASSHECVKLMLLQLAYGTGCCVVHGHVSCNAVDLIHSYICVTSLSLHSAAAYGSLVLVLSTSGCGLTSWQICSS